MSSTRLRYAFGPFELDPAERLLLRDGRLVVIGSRVFDVLAVLVERSGHLVTKDELLEAVWPGVVVTENVLSVTVSRLRAALGDEGRTYIQAVHGQGYRFLAPAVAHTPSDEVSGPRLEDVFPMLATSGDGVAPPAPSGAAPMQPARWRPKLWQVGVLAGLGLLIVSAALLIGRGDRPRGDRPAAAIPDPAGVEGAQPSPEALLAYRRGRALWESRHGGAMSDALYHFRYASALDSTFAAAYVGEAQVYATGRHTAAAAEAVLRRALALDSTLAEAWATLGFVRAFQRWDWAGADAAFALARELDPGDVTTLQWLASLRMVQRRLPEAEAALRRAIALDPDRANLHADLCEALYYRRAYDDALAACDRALALDPAHPFAWQHRFWAVAALTADRDDAAPALLDALGVWYDRHPEFRGDSVLFARGDVEGLLLRLATAFLADPAGLGDPVAARFYALLGERDAAITHAERAVAGRHFLAPFLHSDPLFDPFRDGPRWSAAMHRMGLE